MYYFNLQIKLPKDPKRDKYLRISKYMFIMQLFVDVIKTSIRYIVYYLIQI